MDISAAIATLLGSLETLRSSIHAGEHDRAEQVVADYDRDVRSLFEAQPAPVSIEQIARLLAVQHAVMDEMRQLRDTAAGHLAAGHQSLRAARAYRGAETLA